MASLPRERPPYEIVVVDTPEQLQTCLDIRIQVFVTEQGINLDEEIDQYDTDPEEAAKVVYLLLNKLELPEGEGMMKRVPIGVVRIIPSRNKLGRLAILKPYRSYGFGRVLVESVHDWMRKQLTEEQNKMNIGLHAQLYAIPFYEKCGYRPEGEPFYGDGAMHQNMVAEITRA
ncbi:hypothetical protein NCC49_005613 [Naganishia albida]|nr:hypothetical protein NCC49_005613 [Naganishia albida]